MDKKIIQCLFANVCAKDELRPIMNGVHFEEDRVYASDGHVLIVYNEGSKKLHGKTIAIDGNEINGKYPNVDSVVPSKENRGKAQNVDLVQLKAACQYHLRLPDTQDRDSVVIGGVGFDIKGLHRALTAVLTCESAGSLTLYLSEPSRATSIIGKKTTCVFMPSLYEEAAIDSEREDYMPSVYSYENFINDYVFNGWKKVPAKNDFGWLD